jgi:AraC-like DNA-binding protein
LFDIPNITFRGNANSLSFDLLKASEVYSKNEKELNHNPRKPHRINFFALLIVTEGIGTHQVDLKNFALKKGSVLKIAKGQVHAFQENASYSGFLVIFKEEFILTYFSKSSIESISHLYNYHLSDPLVENISFSESFIEEVTGEQAYENGHVQQNILAKILELFLLKLERVSQNPISTTKTNQYLLFFQFKNLVEEGFRTTRNVKDYAAKLSVSPKHLNTIVKNFTRATAKAFIDHYVLLEIKRAILSTDKSLKEIAFEVGFDEVTNFTKFFKKHTNQSPKDFKSTLKL